MATRDPARSVAAFDSATAMLAATARALRGEPFHHLGRNGMQAALVRASALLPTAARRQVYALLGGREGVPPRRLVDVDLQAVAAWAAGQYDERPAGGAGGGTGVGAQPPPRWPAAFIGASNGALTHVYAATGAGWLPQTFLVPVRWSGNDPDRPDAACAFGAEVAGPLLARNPDVVLHHMHDGNQDRLMVSRMAYFRVKMRRLPAAYRTLLERRLERGAPVVVVRDTSRWPVTRVGPRHVFQTGAQGGLPAADYLQRWPDAPATDAVAPEAEWGLDDHLVEDVAAWGRRHGHPVLVTEHHGPQARAGTVADLYRTWLTERGLAADRLLVESFIVLDPYEVLRAGLVPYWTFFPVEPAAAELAAYLDAAQGHSSRAFREISVLLFSHGVVSAGLTGAAQWRTLADRATEQGRLLAVDAARFPADFATLGRYGPALAGLPSALGAGQPVPRMPVEEALRALGARPV